MREPTDIGSARALPFRCCHTTRRALVNDIRDSQDQRTSLPT